ncbi:MAG: PRD domain-containing protein [Gordonia sp. (in: high G+C Gram-positive bacteria)]
MLSDRRSTLPQRIVTQKVLNNNVVITLDATGAERVLMGRGLGFQRKPGDVIDPATVEKTFVLDDAINRDHVHHLIGEVPYQVVEAVSSAVDEAERFLGHDLGRGIVIAVIDHVAYLLERLATSTSLPATEKPELQILHPREFEAASRMAASIGAALDVELPPNENVFLTMHVLNATRDEPNGTAALLLSRVQHVVATVESSLGVSLHTDSAIYARFVVHVQFLLQRLVTKTMLTNADSTFFQLARRSYPRSAGIVDAVKAYVARETGQELSEEELLYLILHVERLSQQINGNDTTSGGVGSAVLA